MRVTINEIIENQKSIFVKLCDKSWFIEKNPNLNGLDKWIWNASVFILKPTELKSWRPTVYLTMIIDSITFCKNMSENRIYRYEHFSL